MFYVFNYRDFGYSRDDYCIIDENDGVIEHYTKSDIAKFMALRNDIKVSDNVYCAIDIWFELYVPGEGSCDTLLGELVRALSFIGYRWNNDGDWLFSYAEKNVHKSYSFLKRYIKDIPNYRNYGKSDTSYSKFLNDLTIAVTRFIDMNYNKLKSTSFDGDSRKTGRKG